MASATEPAWSTSFSTQALPEPRAKVGTESSSVSRTRRATALTKAEPTMLPDSMMALSARGPKVPAWAGAPSAMASTSASGSGSARRRWPVSGPSSLTPVQTRSEPSAPRKAAMAPASAPTQVSGVSISRPSRVSWPSALTAAPQPTVASSRSAPSWRRSKVSALMPPGASARRG